MYLFTPLPLGGGYREARVHLSENRLKEVIDQESKSSVTKIDLIDEYHSKEVNGEVLVNVAIFLNIQSQ